MSLDITLYRGTPSTYAENGVDVIESDDYEELHWQNITHNLNRMADAAGFYHALWRGEGVETAKDLGGAIEAGLQKMKEDPKHFEQYNAPNGWGLYKHFVPWLEELLKKCREFPNAKVHHCR